MDEKQQLPGLWVKKTRAILRINSVEETFPLLNGHKSYRLRYQCVLHLSIALSESAKFWTIPLINRLLWQDKWAQNVHIRNQRITGERLQRKEKTKRNDKTGTKEKENQLLKFVVQEIMPLFPLLIRPEALPLAWQSLTF